MMSFPGKSMLFLDPEVKVMLNILLPSLLSLIIGADGYYYYTIAECTCSSSDLTDAEYVYSSYFNKELSSQFNSTVGRYVGFDSLGKSNADAWNDGPEIEVQRARLEGLCKPGLKQMYSYLLDKTVKPKVRLTSEPEPSGGHTAMLMCSAYRFYPPDIDVYWLRDGEKVTSEVISTDEMADGDWYYQVHSHLEYTPRSGERISCVVEHASFSGPMTYDWDPSLSESERNKFAIGASGLVLGIILSAAGFIYYKKKSSGRVLVPGSCRVLCLH
ncbi:H-2 class II histocompatibility antigen, E-S beta chain-like [Hoplias malabaricus]|uniref:H-2 class II histocompatibility antigen, E-S beta chain-like n=1 Tax=Hoplias malabaricus TaxID=27720 RepID=UPI00346195EB